MVKRCSYGLCDTDDRYPERLQNNVKFVPFPKPKKNLERCLKWIRLCGRPHSQLNPSKIDKNKYVCTKHFVNQEWPTEENPDPLPADPLTPNPTKSRKPPSKRIKLDSESDSIPPVLNETTSPNKENIPESCSVGVGTDNTASTQAAVQTKSKWIEPKAFMNLVAENERLKKDLSKAALENIDTNRRLKESEMTLGKQQSSSAADGVLSIERIIDDKKLIKYYTGFNKKAFLAIFKFLVPDDSSCPFSYTGKGNLSQIATLSLKNQLLLTLCKLKNDSELKDLAFRFSITEQVAGIIFNSWINFMYLRFGEVSFWPHRDVLFKHMPDEYKQHFPNTFVIADCTEIKIEKPSSLRTQSQTYSDYKSANTLKALVASDPRGSIIFSSMLFGGAISDKEIFKQSGFQRTLTELVDVGHLKQGDGFMADKGFDIETEVEETGLKLNIPPFAHSGSQMNKSEVTMTKKIAKHRVHVERAIRRIKTFKILSGRIRLSLMSSINQIRYGLFVRF